MPSGFNSIWQSATASSYYAVKCDTVAGRAGIFGGGACADSTILGGPLSATGTHFICAPCSTIVMGESNGIFRQNDDGYNAILNGRNNTIYGLQSSIANGDNNSISSGY